MMMLFRFFQFFMPPEFSRCCTMISSAVWAFALPVHMTSNKSKSFVLLPIELHSFIQFPDFSLGDDFLPIFSDGIFPQWFQTNGDFGHFFHFFFRQSSTNILRDVHFEFFDDFFEIPDSF